MSNNWNIPAELEGKVRERDTECVYCHVKFQPNPKDRASWEHIDNDEKNITEENIVLCCSACNSSKGTKTLTEWLNTPYCAKKGITKDSVAAIIKDWIRKH